MSTKTETDVVAPEVITSNQVKAIPLKQIVASQLNHRKEFDEASILELAQSIRENGLIQPITVRPMKGKKDVFEIVCGERRFRASQLVNVVQKDRDTILTVVRDLSDEQALEIMIIENLQRKDVHPMDEAVGFRQLRDKNGKWTIEMIAQRVGRSPKYVAQRMKLTDLLPEWQKAFYANKFILSDAMMICRLSTEAQKDYWDRKTDKGKNTESFNISNYQLKSYSGDLSNPPFDPADPSLSPKFGACGTCPHNTANNTLLFPEFVSSPRCMNIGDYKHKQHQSYQKNLKQLKDDPTMLVVCTSYSEKNKDMKELESKKIPILSPRDYNEVDPPEPVDINDFDVDDYDSEKEQQEQITLAQKEYEKDLAEYKKSVESGKYPKAFVIDGNNQGKTIYIELNKKAQAASKTTSKSNADAKPDIKELITGIQDREKRAKQLDYAKYLNNVEEQIQKSKIFKEERALSAKELDILLAAIYCKADYQISSAMRTASGIKSSLPASEEMKKLFALSPKIKGKIARIWLYRNLQESVYNGPHTENELMIAMAAENGVDLKAIQKEHQETITKRQARVEERIAKLKQELKPAKVPAAKKKAK